MFKLVIEDEDGRRNEIPVVRDEVSIGRKEGNTVRLPERNVSRRHARVFNKDGALWLEDVSRYGVKLNGARMQDQVRLEPGDHIQIGDYDISLKQEGVPDASTDAPPPPPVLRSDDSATDPVSPAPAPAAQAAAEPDAQLIVLSTLLPKLSYPLHGEEVTLGREGDVDIELDHPSISRTHAGFRTNGKVWSVIDLGAANGIRVNGSEVGAIDLKTGDVLELGEVKLRFVRQGEKAGLENKVASYAATRAEANQKTLITALAAAVLVLLAILIGLLATGGDDAPEPAPTPTVPATAVAPVVAPPDIRSEVSEARDAMEERDWNEAISVLEEALQEAPGHPVATQLLRKAKAEAARAATAQPDLAALAAAGRFDAIEQALAGMSPAQVSNAETALAPHREARAAALVARGNRAMSENELQLATAAFAKALLLDPSNADASRGKFLLEMRLRDAPAPQPADDDEGDDEDDDEDDDDGTDDGTDDTDDADDADDDADQGAAVPSPTADDDSDESTASAVPAADTDDGAEDAGGTASDGQPTPDAVRRSMVLYFQGRRLMKTDATTGVARLREALKLNPTLATAYLILGRHFAETGGPPDQACSHLQRFLELKPRHAQSPAVKEQLRKLGCR